MWSPIPVNKKWVFRKQSEWSSGTERPEDMTQSRHRSPREGGEIQLWIGVRAKRGFSVRGRREVEEGSGSWGMVRRGLGLISSFLIQNKPTTCQKKKKNSGLSCFVCVYMRKNKEQWERIKGKYCRWTNFKTAWSLEWVLNSLSVC